MIGSNRVEAWREVEALFTRAIERDPAFVRAYLARASVRQRLFSDGYELSERPLELAREDLAAAQRLAPLDPWCSRQKPTSRYSRAICRMRIGSSPTPRPPV